MTIEGSEHRILRASILPSGRAWAVGYYGRDRAFGYYLTIVIDFFSSKKFL